MEFYNITEHTHCLNYDNSDHAMIDLWRTKKGHRHETVARYNTIVFLLKGRVSFSFRDYPETQTTEGHFIFIPLGARVVYSGETDSEVLLLRMYDHVRLCESYGIEQLFIDARPRRQEHDICMLEANHAIGQYIASLEPFIDGNFRCRYYLDIKVKEFFVLLRLYYTKEQLRNFFHKILSIDTGFVEVVRNNYLYYNTAYELAEALNLTYSGFSKKFKAVFGQPVYAWMKEQKARAVYKEICTGEKNFKQISEEYGFKSPSQFSEFCRANLGNPPGRIRKQPIKG